MVTPAPSALVSQIFGVVPPKVSVAPATEPVLICQAEAALLRVLPKMMLPTFWLAASKVTAVAAVRPNWLKSAVSVAAGKVPRLQLPVLAQLEGVVVVFQASVAALASRLAEATAANMAAIFTIRREPG